MSTILIADLHLTDAKQDEYRWEIFPFLTKVITNLKIERMIILGDLTEKKDRHSSSLVNRLIENLTTLANSFLSNVTVPIMILQGNHDYINKDYAFFKFLKKMPGVFYIDYTTKIDDYLFIPHTGEKSDIHNLSIKGVGTVFMHHQFEGAKIGNFVMDGLDPKMFPVPIYSGHIHIPQKIGNVSYIGSPYPVDFGDKGNFGVFVLDKKGVGFIPVPSIQKFLLKLTYSNIENLIKQLSFQSYDDTTPGNQYKVEISLNKTDYPEWTNIKNEVKKYIQRRQGVLHSIKMVPEKVVSIRKVTTVNKEEKDLVLAFARHEKVNYRYLKTAREVIQEMKEAK